MKRPPPEFPPPVRQQIVHDRSAATNYELAKAQIIAAEYEARAA